MLPSSHGTSTLGKTLRRPFMTTMSSFEGTSSLATDAMRSTMSRITGGRPASTTARPNTNLPLQKIWHPNHGIVFSPGPAPGLPRRLHMATVEVKQDLLLHSTVEDNYVMASREISALGRQSAPEPMLPISTNSQPSPTQTEPTTPEDPEQSKLPEPCITFSMTESLFRAAKDAATGTPESFWSHTLYRGPESKKPTVHYCRSLAATERVIQSYFMNKKVIGFDIEWAPEYIKYANKTPRTALSLIQIASEERIALFHIAQYPKRDHETAENFVAPSLRKILEDPGVTKVGVAIKADCTRLRKNLGIKAQGLFELSHLYKLVKFSESKDTHLINKMLVSLATQVKEHLHLPLFKGEVRGSDWSQALSMAQIMYAASDSYAAVQLYYTLDAKRNRLEPTPPLPWHAELDRPIRVAEGIEIPTDGEDEPEESPKSVRKKYTRAVKKDQAASAEDIEMNESESKETESDSYSESASNPSSCASPRDLGTRVRSHV